MGQKARHAKVGAAAKASRWARIAVASGAAAAAGSPAAGAASAEVTAVAGLRGAVAAVAELWSWRVPVRSWRGPDGAAFGVVGAAWSRQEPYRALHTRVGGLSWREKTGPGEHGSPVATRKDVRASDAERDSAAAALQEHFVQGRLTLGELQERLDSVLAARTHGQLDQIFSDMPRLPPQLAVPERAEPPVFPARYAAVAIMIIVMAVWLVLAAWFSQRGYGYGYGYPPTP